MDDRVKGTEYGVGPVTPTSPRSGSRPSASKQLQTRASVPLLSPDDVGFDSMPTATLPGADLAPGTLVAQYELIREIGRGGMGVVYAARDLKLGRRVAMKFLRQVDREVVERFLVEARATAQCNHDNIVIIYQVDEYDGMPYMVLEYLEGRPLRELMGTFGNGEPMLPTRVVELMVPVARALARAAELGIVHRDLKPENIFITHNGQVKVLDFGIAKALGTPQVRPRLASQSDQSADLTITREGAMVGTLPYMSPEQMGMDHIDHRSDLFSLGLIMFEMLTGRHPVEPLTADALTSNLITPAPMPSIRTQLPDLSDGLVAIVDECLRKYKHERIASANELVQRLEALLPGRQGRALAEGESPFPGLTAFQEGDADRFFGRSRDVARMAVRVRELPLTCIVGPSGVGKSSFVRAGVGPALKTSGENWDVVTLRPGRQPLAALASIVERFTTRAMLGRAPSQPFDHDNLVQRLRTEPGYLGSLLRTRAQATRSTLLLFVDQFEELYTLVPDVEERRAFTAALSAIADDSAAPLRVVVSMRSDFLDRVGEDQRFLEELSRGLVFLSPPERNGLREALEGPLDLVGYRFETSAMLDEMLDALEGTPGALPLLQFAAAKLWDSRDKARRLLTAESYAAIGGITGALATHADEVVRNMNANGQRLTQKIFRQLVTPERTRAIVELTEIQQLAPDTAEINRVIDLLVAARLLVVQMRREGGGTVELVHESLIERWPMLRRWLDEDLEDSAYLLDLMAAAKQWDAKGRPAGLLWQGDAADDLRRWYTQRPRALAPREQAFVDGVIWLKRRTQRNRRVALVAAFTLLAAVAIGALVAVVRIKAAETRATEALGEVRKKSILLEERATELKAALDRITAAQAAREQAEAKAMSAEEAERKAQLDKQLAEEGERQKDALLGLTKEQLVEKNAALTASVLEAKAAKDKAEAASRAAAAAADVAAAAAAAEKRAKIELQRLLDEEKARVKKLEEESKKFNKTLKE